MWVFGRLYVQGSRPLPVYVYIQKGDVTFCFCFHSELYVLVYAIQVFQEFHESILSVWPDNEGFIHISVPAGRFVSGCLYGILLKFFHVEICDDRGITCPRTYITHRCF